MQYEIITDTATCQELFDHLEFSIFETRNTKTPFDNSEILDNHQEFFKKYMIQKDFPVKDKRNFLIFNSIDGKKEMVNFHAPRVVMVDFDHLDETELIKYYDQLSKLPATIYCDYSQSNSGIKALIGVYNDYTFDYYFVRKEDEMKIDTELFTDIHKQNVKIVSKYLVDNGIDISLTYLDKKNRTRYKYDPANNTLTQGTYSSNGDHFYFNPTPAFLKYRYKKVKLRKLDIPKDVVKQNTQNSDFLAWFINSYKSVEDKASFQKVLFAKFGHYDDCKSFLNVLKHIDDNHILSFFYKVIAASYAGRKIHLGTYDKFLNYIKNLKGFTKYIIPAESFLSDLKVFFKNEQVDLFENRYDSIIRFDTYLTEKQPELFNIFDSNKLTVLRSKPGTGKTSLLHQYILKCFDNGCKTIVFTIPKNSLNTQQFKKIVDLFAGSGIEIIRNFGKYKYIKEECTCEQRLIISSTPKLKNIIKCDLLIIDEIQNLVFYSKVISSNVPVFYDKMILLSATPEPYLIGMNDYYYVNCVNKSIKPDIKVVYSRSVRIIFDKYLDPNRKQLFFLNDCPMGIEMKNKYSDKVNFFLVNAKQKKNYEIIDLLENELIKYNHVIGTSYISDGINFNNDKWDDLFIIENDSLTVFEAVQLSYRFRKVKDLNIVLFARKRKNADEEKPIKFKYINAVSEYKRLQYSEFEKVLEGLTSHSPGDALVNIDGMFELNGKYTFNHDYLKLLNFEGYHWRYKLYTHIFYGGLEYYFNVVSTEEMDNNALDKVNIDELKKFVKKNINFLVQYKCGFEVNYDDLFDMTKDNENAELIKVIEDNRDYFDIIFARIKELLTFGGDPIDCLLGITYQRKIESLKLKQVLSAKNGELKNATEIVTKLWVNKFIEWLLKQDIFKENKGKKYFIVDDVVELLKDLPDELLEESYINFNMQTAKLTKYLRNIERFKYGQIRLDDGTRISGFIVSN